MAMTRDIPPEKLAALAERVGPGALAAERTLPVVPALETLLPGGLRRGSVVATDGVAATSLALALAAGPSVAGAWVGAIGMPSLGVLAAAELGVAVERLFLVASPPAGQWAEIVAAVIDGAEVVLASPPAGVPVGAARRLQARLGSRGAVLLLTADERPGASGFQPDVRLRADEAVWEGIGEGSGRLLARRVRITVSGRRASARPITCDLLLPGPSGGVETLPAIDVPRVPGVPDVPGRHGAPRVPEAPDVLPAAEVLRAAG